MRFILLIALLVPIAGCTQTNVFETDLTRQRGVYIVGYTPDKQIRVLFENQLRDDLAVKNIIGYPSHNDIEDITSSDAELVLKMVNAHKNVAVVVINQVTLENSTSIIKNPNRISPDHPDLRAFYEHTKEQAKRTHNTTGTVFAEVNAFAVDGEKTRLVWSGTTWSFDADGAGGAITGISDMIASELVKIRDRYRQN